MQKNGIAGLAVAYSGRNGLPSNLANIELDNFQSAVAFVDAHEQLQRNACNRIGVIGSSRGAELAVLLGTHYQAFGPIIAIAPSSHVWGGIPDTESAWLIDGQPLTKVKRVSQPNYDVEKFVGRSAQVQHLNFVDAGHVLAPGMPAQLTEAEVPSGTTLMLGGTPKANQQAQREGLQAIIATLTSDVCFAAPATAGFDAEKLTAVTETAKSANSSSVVLMHDQKVVFSYGDIFQKHLIHYELQKSQYPAYHFRMTAMTWPFSVSFI